MKYEKIAGCLWGGAIGDALGAPVEFLPHTVQKVSDYIEFGDGTGSITDDTQMTIFTLEAMLNLTQSSPDCNWEPFFRQSYERWLKTQQERYEQTEKSQWLFQTKELWQQRAPGMTCLNSLSAGNGKNNSKGCGGVMRTAPCGLFIKKEKNKYPFQLGIAAAKITHGHPTGYLTGGFLAQLIYEIVFEDHKLPLAITGGCLSTRLFNDYQETLNAVYKAMDMYENHTPCTPENIAQLGEGWIAEEALAISLFCALSYQDDFKSGVLAAVNITGDRDSAGAITGNILGALNGLNTIPQCWLDNLREKNVLDQAISYFR